MNKPRHFQRLSLSGSPLPADRSSSLSPSILSAVKLLLWLLASLAPLTHAQDRLFGILGKSAADPNFVAVAEGCDREARQHGDRCELLGDSGSADFRLQVRALERIIKQGQHHALAISVTHSENIARALLAADIPIITFDSPFQPAQAALSRAYVGVDNRAMGETLAQLARERHPQGGTLCLMTSPLDPNLAERIGGLRTALSGDPDYPPGKRLQGEGGWRENPRCPWYTGDHLARALFQLSITLRTLDVDAFISVGHWPVVDPARYRALLAEHADKVRDRKVQLLFAVGSMNPDYWKLLEDGLVQGMVSIDFDAMGKACYHSMRSLLDGNPGPKAVHTPVRALRSDTP